MKNLRLCVCIFLALALVACGSSTPRRPQTTANGIDYEKAMESYINAANQYLRKKDADNALRHLRKAANLNEKDQRVHTGLAYAFELTQDYALAESHHKKAIALGGQGEARARNNYATYLFKQRRFNEAKDQLDNVVADVLYNRRSGAFTTLGLVELQLGDVDGAMIAFSRAVNLDRRNSLASIELADIFIQKREYAAAEFHYNTFKYIGPVSARGLLIGIKLGQALSKRDLIASNALALKNLFPASVEYQEYLRLYQND